MKQAGPDEIIGGSLLDPRIVLVIFVIFLVAFILCAIRL